MVEIRRFRSAADGASLRALLHAARRRGELPDLPERHVDLFVEYLATTENELAVAIDDGGTMVGAVLPEMKVAIVEPERRRGGIGTSLVEEGLRIERERGRPNLLMGPRVDDEGALDFLRASGFRYHSSVWRLDLPGHVEVPAPVVPAELLARPFQAGDEEAYLDVFNAAFASHPTPLAETIEGVRFMVAHREFDPTEFRLLVRPERPGRIEGFCVIVPVRETEGGPIVEGEVALIGVRPESQGQGVGRELLRWGVARLRALAVPSVFLTVNVTNPRALTLYERHGFVRTREKPRWALPVPS